MQVREAMGFKNEPYIDVEAVLDFILPQALEEFSYDVSPSRKMGENHGLALPDQRSIILREDVFERACDGKGRDRFTVMHELGHVLLHGKDRIVHRRGTGQPKTYCNPEWQADCFAGELLVAHTLIDGSMTPIQVAAKFGVSNDAASYQLRKLREAGTIK